VFPDVFDPRTVATMLANGVQRIHAFNPGDFQVVAELTVVTPTQQAGAAGGTKNGT
jgi:hypothetical protein